MLSAVGRFERSPVELAVGMAFERRFRLFAINRRGLTFDTQFSPAARGATNGVIVYLLLEGTLRWDSGVEVHGPSLFLMRESVFEGAHGSRTSGFRSWGTPFRSVELRVAPEECIVADWDTPLVTLSGASDPIVTAGRLYLHASHAKNGQKVVSDLAAQYLVALQSRGVLASDLASTITQEDLIVEVLWDALRPALESFGVGAKLDDLIARVGWPARRLQRVLMDMVASHGSGWAGGWREVVVRYRVRVAVLLLSSPSLSIGEVANAVGYGSVEALAHALATVGLPSATEVRRQLLAVAV